MDWKAVFIELHAYGMTQPEIATVCGCGQTTISALATGKTAEPRDSLGQALRRLLDAKRAEKLDQVPQSAACPSDRRDPARPSQWAGTDLDRRAQAQEPSGV